ASALEFVPVDFCVPMAEIGRLLVRLVGEPAVRPTVEPPPAEMTVGKGEGMSHTSEDQVTLPEAPTEPGPLGGFTCPHCSGHLWEVHDAGLLRFRCRVGHAYTAESLLDGKAESLESTLWAALNLLEENAALCLRMTERARERGHTHTAQRLQQRALESERHARLLREFLNSSPAFTPDEDGNPATEPAVA
ncbi:MAG TPA: chemotaxis protein CheB, partial [Armatimonadota bacterium]|nr:chemotaxis protein CheB [Armatimonadota bacterium]